MDSRAEYQEKRREEKRRTTLPKRPDNLFEYGDVSFAGITIKSIDVQQQMRRRRKTEKQV